MNPKSLFPSFWKQLPNLLGGSRILLAPLTLWVLEMGVVTRQKLWLGILIGIFIYVEASDILDGQLARRYNIESGVGQLLDPFADLIFHITLFFWFTKGNYLISWVFLAIVYREFFMLFLRNMLLQRGFTLKARFVGKLKTASYFLLSLLLIIVWALEFSDAPPPAALGQAVMLLSAVSVFLAYLSLFHYSHKALTLKE